MLALMLLVNALLGVLALVTGGEQPPGRRGGPEPVGAPADEDRDQVAKIQADAAKQRELELKAQADAAEPAGEPPSDQQRQAILDIQQRSADVRGAAARALRRQPVAVGTIYDDERDQVATLHQEQRERRLAELADRGIDDPAVEGGTAGFDADLPNLPGADLFGVFVCPTCGGQVERAFPGYVDWDAATRELHCPHCGGLVTPGGTGKRAATRREAARVQTSAQTEGFTDAERAELEQLRQAAGLTDDERAELEQLRSEKAAPSSSSPKRSKPDQAAGGDQPPPQQQ